MIWTKNKIVYLLETSDLAVEKAILALYARQTIDEKELSSTKNYNERGFNLADAWIFSLFAKDLLNGKKLSSKQLTICRRKDHNKIMKIGKYAKQLLEIAKEKGFEISNKNDKVQMELFN